MCHIPFWTGSVTVPPPLEAAPRPLPAPDMVGSGSSASSRRLPTPRLGMGSATNRRGEVPRRGKETAMRQYIVYRHGWNEANQRREDGAPEKMPVLRVDAGSPEDACRRA